MSSRARVTAAVVVAAAVIAGLAALAYRRAGSAPPALHDYGTLPDFELRDQTGKTVRRSDLAGKVVLVNFIFTRCPTVCPTFSMKMQRIAKRVRDHSNIRLVSYSVDPDYDTPERLARFGADFDADPEQWSFLTGDESLIKDRITAGLAIALEQRGTLPSGTPDIVHGTHIVLIDGEHRIRGYYNSDSMERIDELVRDAQALAEAD